MDVGRHETSGLGHTVAALHVVAFGYDGFGGRADVLCHREHYLGGKRHVDDGFAGSYLVFSGMYTADFECMQFH